MACAWAMPAHSFGRLRLDIPDGWQDQSIITLVKPPKGRMATAGVTDVTRNLIISRAEADGSFTAAELAAVNLESLQAALPDLKVISEETVEVAGQPAIAREIQFATPEKGLVQQLQVFVIVGDLALTCVATGSAGLSFSNLRKEALKIFQGMAIEEDGES